ncbi:MAG: hypothetical protein ACTSQV_04105 [Alphaproteobacteria bacterium]
MGVNKQRIAGGNFAVLRAARRVWAIGSIHGDAVRLHRLQAQIGERVEPGDRLVYLGNVLGRGEKICAAVDVVLGFRRAFLAQPGAFVHDVALLRGAQEEMWQKLLQLQFSLDPNEVLKWLVEQGVGATIEAYGSSVEEGFHAVRLGAVAITRWTAALRKTFQSIQGHQEYLSALRHAAFTEDGALLLVNAGIAPDRPLEAQNDSFWWGAPGFDRLDAAYGGYRKVVYGSDPEHGGVEEGRFSINLDSGCGFGGALSAACITPAGEMVDLIEA